MQNLSEFFWTYAQPFVFGLPRVATMFLVLSALPDAIVPKLVRGGLAVSLVLALYPMLGTQAEAISKQSSVYFLLLKEIGVGALLGIALGSIFWVIQSVGTLIDNQVGTNMAEVFDPFGGHTGGPWAEFTSVLCVALFVLLGGFHVAFTLLVESYIAWPLPAEFIQLEAPLIKIADDFIANVAANALRLAMPVIFLLCIVELGLGLINRAAPQLNVFIVAMPVKAVLATLVVAISFSQFISAVGAHFAHAAEWLGVVTGTPIKR